MRHVPWPKRDYFWDGQFWTFIFWRMSGASARDRKMVIPVPPVTDVVVKRRNRKVFEALSFKANAHRDFAKHTCFMVLAEVPKQYGYRER
jgi:hypothetical protein